MSFDRAYPFLRHWEGGDSLPRPGDPNPTRAGITQAFYDSLPPDLFPPKSVFDLTEPEIEAVYRWLWTDCRADQMPEDVAFAYFDAVVNLGEGQAAKQLQRAVSVTADGLVGPRTLAAVAAANPREVVIRLLGQRLRFYRQLADRKPEKARFLIGWTRRVVALQEALGL